MVLSIDSLSYILKYFRNYFLGIIIIFNYNYAHYNHVHSVMFHPLSFVLSLK